MKKRYMALALCVLTVFMSFGYCFADNYDETNGLGTNKITTNFTLSEEEGFKVSVPATNEISWFTGSVENTITFTDVLLAPDHTLNFGIDVGNSTFLSIDNKFMLMNTADTGKKVMLDIKIDGTKDFNCNSPQMFSFTDPVDSESHTIKFIIDKDYVSEDFPNEKYYPIAGATYQGKIVYLITIS